MNKRQQTNRNRWWALPTLAGVTLALVLSACGSDNNTTSSSASGAKPTCATGSVDGAGSTFVQNLAQEWVKNYQLACHGSTVNYHGVGSSTGIQQFNAGTVDFAASDVPLSAADQQTADSKHAGGVTTIPWASGAVALEFKLSGTNSLKMSSSTIAGIFAGTITKWNDAQIAADNPGVSLPATPIQVIHRSDGSGTSAALTAYMTANAPDVWKAGSSKDPAWPTGQGAKGSDGVTAAVKQTEGAIGYAEVSFAKANSLGLVTVKNSAGQFVGPESPDAVTAALKESTIGPDLKVTMNYKPVDPKAYPISTFTYVIVPKSPADPAKAALLKAFIQYALSGGQSSAAGLYYAPLPETVTTPAKAAVAGIGS